MSTAKKRSRGNVFDIGMFRYHKFGGASVVQRKHATGKPAARTQYPPAVIVAISLSSSAWSWRAPKAAPTQTPRSENRALSPAARLQEPNRQGQTSKFASRSFMNEVPKARIERGGLWASAEAARLSPCAVLRRGSARERVQWSRSASPDSNHRGRGCGTGHSCPAPEASSTLPAA